MIKFNEQLWWKNGKQAKFFERYYPLFETWHINSHARAKRRSMIFMHGAKIVLFTNISRSRTGLWLFRRVLRDNNWRRQLSPGFIHNIIWFTHVRIQQNRHLVDSFHMVTGIYVRSNISDPRVKSCGQFFSTRPRRWSGGQIMMLRPPAPLDSATPPEATSNIAPPDHSNMHQGRNITSSVHRSLIGMNVALLRVRTRSNVFYKAEKVVWGHNYDAAAGHRLIRDARPPEGRSFWNRIVIKRD